MGDGGGITEEELAAFHRTVGRLRALPVDDPVRLRAERVAASFARDGWQRRRKARGAEKSAADAAVDGRDRHRRPGPARGRRRCRTAAGGGRTSSAGRATAMSASRPIDRSTPSITGCARRCAADNTPAAALSTDLSGRRALLTGGRVKIGFQLALMMLRDGADLLVTSRFPHDTVRRFRAEPGSAQWLDRLTVVAVDLRDPRQVLGLCERVAARRASRSTSWSTTRRRRYGGRRSRTPLLAAGEHDALPEGARRAPGFTPMRMLEGGGRRRCPSRCARPTRPGCCPTPPRRTPGRRGSASSTPPRSWRPSSSTPSPRRCCATGCCRCCSPRPHPRRYVVNVTAVEGRFAVRNKTAGHPHTNMAKAALNMLTRTSAAELAGEGVYMCAVDTGWITDENPAPKKAADGRAPASAPPLDVVDGAARVYDPIVRGEAGDPVSGVFLKDYREAEW